METSLLGQFDELVSARQSTRSEILRDLVRAELIRSLANRRIDAFASVTIVYNHHVRELSERITKMQHELGDEVRSSMHVHLDDERCLEVIVMRGRADRLQSAAETLFATRGVLQGSIEVVPLHSGKNSKGAHRHEHGEHTHAKRRAVRSRQSAA